MDDRTSRDKSAQSVGDQGEPRRRRLRRRTDSPLAADRSRAAYDAAAELAPGDRTLDQVLSKLAEDQSSVVRKSAAGALSRVMRRAPGLVRLQLLADWVERASALQRLAVARALRRRPTLVGAPSALETLACDPDAKVRDAALRAATRRPTWFRRLLRRKRALRASTDAG